MSWRKRALLLAGLLLIAAALAWAFRPRPVSVDTALVSRGELQVSVVEEGRTRVVERYRITAPVSGFLQRVRLHVGDRVAAGQVLFAVQPAPAPLLDPRSQAEARAAVAAAEAELERAQAEAEAARAVGELARADLTRARTLFQREQISREAYDRALQEEQAARARLRSAEAAVRVARYELARARAALEGFGTAAPGDPVTVGAPADGVVLAVLRESAGVVGAGEAVLELGDPARLEVVAELLTADAVQLAPGAPVSLEDWGGPPLEAVVQRVEPAGFTKVSALGVEEQRTRVVAAITAPRTRWMALGDGYRVQARFQVWHAADTLMVPEGAVFRHDGGFAVYRVGDGIARRTPVQVGRRNGLQAQLLGGLEAGDRVVVYPPPELRDGDRVAPVGGV